MAVTCAGHSFPPGGGGMATGASTLGHLWVPLRKRQQRIAVARINHQIPLLLTCGAFCHDRYHPPKAEVSSQGVSHSMSRSQECSLGSHPISTSELLSSGRRWQGTGETGARACHATWRRLPLTQARSVFSSSSYTPCLADMSQPCSALLPAFLMWPDNRTLN